MSEQTELIENIRTVSHDIDELKGKIKTSNEVIQEIVEKKNAYAEVERLSEELHKAKEALKSSLMGDGDYNNKMEHLADLKLELKDLQDILSQHVALFWKDTGERQIEMNEATGDAREVVITGRLGKEGKLQTSMFVGQHKEPES